MSTEERESYRDRLTEAVAEIDCGHDRLMALCAPCVVRAVLSARDAEHEVLTEENTRLAADLIQLRRMYDDLCAAMSRTGDRLVEVKREKKDLRLALDGAGRHIVELGESHAEALHRAERAEAQLAEAKKKIDDLSSSLDRVRQLCARGPGPHNEYQIWTADVLAILDNPPPGDTPEPNRSEP